MEDYLISTDQEEGNISGCWMLFHFHQWNITISVKLHFGIVIIRRQMASTDNAHDSHTPDTLAILLVMFYLLVWFLSRQ